MNRFARHTIQNRTRVQENYLHDLKQLPVSVASIPQRPANLDALVDRAYYVLTYGSVIDPGAAVLGHAVRIAAEATNGLFAVFASMGKEVSFRLDGRDLTFPTAKVDESMVYAAGWVRGFHLALIARDRVLLDQLCAIPIYSFLGTSTTRQFDDVPIVETLRSFWAKEPGLEQRLSAAAEGLRQALNIPEAKPIVQSFELPNLELLRCLLFDPNRFHQALATALELHKKFWSQPSRARSNRGFVALAPMAYAALAYDRGIPFDVQSDYMPQGLVDGSLLSTYRSTGRQDPVV